ncbi:ATP-binding protein [Serpentinicella sp. ANB-PHB4]|uniref:Lon protease family protein n=1 Tax=Serpentinicella sp. ANB-PHB4 TaxID=3074076 RepID=UPI002857D141|nr:ATP-binding protein [Serpentinicella sp. ANB-PHB4]MDR5659001.1 ATP-binding protein [Serpentinicella sp. ANB-PHB4]
MKNKKALSYKSLKRYCDISNLKFTSTNEISKLDGMLGQKDGEEAMEFGLQIDHHNYNIFLSGDTGTGKTNYSNYIVRKISKNKATPDDWCYVYSFDTPRTAIALSLPAGQGKIFQKEIDKLLDELLVEIPKAFNSEAFDRQKNEVVKQYQEAKNELLHTLSEFAKSKNFELKNTSTGFAFTPIDDSVTNELEKDHDEVQEEALSIMLKIKNLERRAKKQLSDLENGCASFVIKPLIEELKEKYKKYEKVVNHLKNIKKNMIENVYQFIPDEDENPNTIIKLEEDPILKKYRVNLFVDHSSTEGAPVVIAHNPSLSQLTGVMEYENINGSLKTDILMLKSGAIQQANGGYLIVEAKRLLSNPYAWETLKRMLQTKEITVESIGNQLGVDVSSLKLEPIPVKLKIILIGNEYLYHLLYQYDEDFQKYFKIFVDFDNEMKRTVETEYLMARYVSTYTQKENILPFDATGVSKLVEYSSRLTGRQDRLSTRFNKIIEIILEANQWAKIDNKLLVTEQHVKKAIIKKLDRLNKYQNKIEEMYDNEKVLIDVEGEKVGIVNGLSVISIGEYSFGKPSVISVTTSAGKEGIINIEREVNQSGDIYDKGIMILTGFIMEKFGQEKSLSFTSRICFEQSYGGIDGDSASSAELYALCSSIGKIPITQSIAVTGSVNQKGFIQPIGGVTEKIEGFYDLCKKRGLNKQQGVIIPFQNVDNLMLKDEVIESVRKGEFYIYAIKHIDEGIEIMTGVTADKVYKIVEENLINYSNNTNSK